MTEADWLAADDPGPMLTLLSTTGNASPVLRFSAERVSGRKLRLFCVACCRMVWTHLREPDLRQTVELSEAFADDPAVYSALSKALGAVEAINNDEFDSGFVGGPTTQGLWERTAAVCQASRRTVRPEGVAAIVAVVAGEVRRNGTTSRAGAALLRDIVGNPFRSVTFAPSWQTSTVVALADGIYADRAFDRLPILADALEEAGCDQLDVLAHCRGPGPHARGCWVVDGLLGKT